MHPFVVRGVGPRAELIDPIWEYYHHDTGKSIIGGVFNHYMPGVSIQIGRETETGLRHSWEWTS